MNDLEEEIYSTKKSLQEKLDSTLKNLKSKAEKSIQDYFMNGLLERIKKANKPDYINTLDKLDIHARNFLLSPIPVPNIFNDIFPESLSQFIKYEVGLSGRNQFEFKNKKEADDFVEQLVIEAKLIVEPLLYQTIKEIETYIKQSQDELFVLLSRNTKDIIINASKRLNESFDINLELPPIAIDYLETDFRTPKVNVIQFQDDFDILGKVVNFFRNLFGFESKNTSKQNYTVSLQETVNHFNNSIENRIKQIKVDILKNIDISFKNRILAFSNELRSYLKNYKASLEKALKDQKLSLVQQEEVRLTLKSISSETDKLAKSIKDKQEYTFHLIQKI